MHVVTLVRREANRWKFWEATIDGPLIEIATGPVGGEADADYQRFASPAAAFSWLEREVALRRSEGYVDPERRQDVAALGPATVAREPSLEARLQVDPDDLDTYLVYADWLEAAGDPRGRLIMLQHRREREPDNGELAQAESELLLHYADHFFPEHGEGSALEARWHLGFIRRAIIGSAASLRGLLAHPSAALLVELQIFGVIDRQEFVDAVEPNGARPTLREVRVSLTDGDALGSVWSLLPNLERVTIGGTDVLEGAETSRWRTLDLTDEVDSSEVAHLCRPQWPELESLCVHLGEQPAERLAGFFEGRAMPALRTLSLIASPGMIPMVAAANLIGQLRVLRLRDCDLTDDDVASLSAHGASFQHLHTLDLSKNYLSEVAANRLRSLARSVVTAPQHDDDEFDDDDDYYDEEDRYADQWEHEQTGDFSADVVPVYESEPEEVEDDGDLAIDKTWQRGVVGFDHDD